MKRTGYSLSRVLSMYGVSKSRWYEWQKDLKPEPKKKRNFLAPLPDEIEEILNFRKIHPGVGYRKFTYMLNDANIAYLPESTIFRILKAHNVLAPKIPHDELHKAGKEYRDKPRVVHQHWHMDIAYVKIRGVFYFLIMMLDGHSRFLLDWCIF